MILKGNERGNGRELANHLMKGRGGGGGGGGGGENEHIELHDPCAASPPMTCHGAMPGKRGHRQGHALQELPVFSLSLNPPQNESVRAEVFEAAIGRIGGRAWS